MSVKSKLKKTASPRKLGSEVTAALREVLAHVQGEKSLPVEKVPPDIDVREIRRRLGMTRSEFAGRFGLDGRAVQDWEQGRRRPDRAARVLLAVIDHDSAVVERALKAA
ncbi:MAG TPA: helix-turn-helix domain-containing protein [Reyranella sp.]|nr:helix-turn-helix domain-containing protein [Reyranella sp.]